MLENQQSTTCAGIHHSTISHDEAQRIVDEYIRENIDSHFQVVDLEDFLDTDTSWC